MPVFLLLAVLLVVLDQIVKWAVRGAIPLYGAVPFLPGLNLTYIQNTGAAFSSFSSHTWVLAVVSGIVSVALLVLLVRRTFPHPLGMFSVALLLGGAVGNLIDRALFGYVTDMFATTFVKFAVFNVADIGVTAGAVLLCVYIAFLSGKDKEEKK